MEQLKISAKNLGAVALKNFCPRCYWIKLKLSQKIPWQSFPGIFSSIDSYTKHCVHHIIDNKNLPAWMQQMGNIVGYEKVPHWSKNKYEDQKTGIILSGVPDDILVKFDGGKVIPDYKTAKYTDTQDDLLPMYRIQSNVYSLLIDRTADLFLVYMEPQTSQDKATSNITLSGFKMEFNAVVVPIDRDLVTVRAALNLTRDIYESPLPPAPAKECKDCQSVEKIIDYLCLR